MKTKIKVIASCAFGVSSIIGCSAMAAGDGWSGTGSDSWGGAQQLGVSCDNAYRAYDYRVDCTGVSWLKYIPDVEGSEIQVVPRGNGTEYGTAIGAKCAKAGVGFYHLGINFQGVYTPDHYFWNYTSQPGAIGGYVGALNSNFLNHSASINDVYDIDIGTYEYTYRIAADGYWGHRYNTTVGQVGSGSYNTKDPDSGSTMKFGHKLYKNGKQIYHSEAAATDPDKMPGCYAAFLNNMCGSGSDGCKEQTDGCSYSGGKWTCSAMPSDVFAFCAYPIDNPVGLKPQATITIGSKTATTDLNFNASGVSEKIADGEVIVHSASVSALGGFDYYIEKAIKTTSFKPPMSVAGSSIASPSLSFSGASTHISDGLAETTKTKSTTLEANKSTKVCAETSSPSSISSTTTGGSTLTARACIMVKYVPVTADVDSDTIATINSSYLADSNTKTIYYSHEAGAADKTMTYSNVSVKPGPMKVTWGHYLGYRNLSSAVDGGVWSTTYNLQGGAGLYHKLEIGSYSNPGTTLSNYKWQYYYDNGDGNGEYPSASVGHTKNVRDAGVFPGESSTISQTLKHPAKVNVDDGSKASGSGEEESKVEMTLKGAGIECGLSDGEWSVSGDHKKTIGVSNPLDYRWLAIRRESSPHGFSSVTVVDGDDIDTSKTGTSLWLAPDDTIGIYQKACFGSQIAIDAANKQSNRWTKNPWNSKDDNTNSRFNLDAPQKLKETRVFGNSSFKLNNAAWLQSTGNASLLASEIGISSFKNDQESTPMDRIKGNYQISTVSKKTSIANRSTGSIVNRNLGESLTTVFSKPNGEKATITTNVPYNYYLNLTLDGNMEVITSADAEPQFTAKVQNRKRKNEQVCSGIFTKSTDCKEYSTDTKPTTISMMVFTMGSDFSVEDLKGHASFLREGDATSETSLESNLRGEFATIGKSVGDVKDYKTKNSEFVETTNETVNYIQSGSQWTLESKKIDDLSDLPVGTKLCAAIAAYPSDSHNSEVTGDNLDDYTIDSSNQDGALVPSGQRTKISVKCRTIAKRQNMSVEGNGILTTGSVLSSNILYGGKTFTSWSEYQITSGASSNAASGAATGYNPDKNLTGMDKNKTYFTKDDYSIAADSYLFPQSLGSMTKTEIPSAGEEANIAWNHALNLKKDIKNNYGGGDSCTAPAGADYNLRCFISAEEDVNSAMVAGLAGKPTAVIRNPYGTLRITENIAKPAGTKQLILIAKNIIINNNVSEINAWLIVDGGEFNTCADHHIDDPADNGNNRLLTECNDWLYIKGPVIVDSAGSPLELPRTFGGGSKLQNNRYVIDEPSFVQRAEIFDFDPDMVRWAYEESTKDPQLSTTYVETLAPKL